LLNTLRSRFIDLKVLIIDEFCMVCMYVCMVWYDPYSAIFGSCLWSPFKFFELTEIMRQRDNQPFAITLNNMASGQMSSDDIRLLRTRISDESQVPNDEAIHFS